MLIMMSLLEHRVQILVDRAIDEKVPKETWQTVVQELIQETKDGHPAEGLVRAIERCGGLLAEYFPPRGDDNPDELRDDLIHGSR